MTILPYTMFDDGSFESYNYWLADRHECWQVGPDNSVITRFKEEIQLAQQAGLSYLNIKSRHILDNNEVVIEIQWS